MGPSIRCTIDRGAFSSERALSAVDAYGREHQWLCDYSHILGDNRLPICSTPEPTVPHNGFVACRILKTEGDLALVDVAAVHGDQAVITVWRKHIYE